MEDYQHHNEEQLSQDIKLLKKLEDKLRYEYDPRLQIKWENDIRDVKQQIIRRKSKQNYLANQPVVLRLQDNLHQRKIDRTKKELELVQKEYETLSRKIAVIIKRLGTVIDTLEEDSLKQRKLEFEHERNLVGKEIEQLEKKLEDLE